MGTCPLPVVTRQEEPFYLCCDGIPCGPGIREVVASWGCSMRNSCCHTLVQVDLCPTSCLWAGKARIDCCCNLSISSPLHRDQNPRFNFTPPLVELGRGTIICSSVHNHLLPWQRCWCRLCSCKGCNMVLEANLPLGELGEDVL